MIGLLGAQLLAILGFLLLLGVPGWACSRLLQLQLVLPTIVLPPAGFLFGLAVWTVALVPSLAFGWPIAVTLALHAALTLALVTWAVLRDRRRGHAKLGTDALSGWTIAAIALAGLLAAAFRTRMAFDTLFHVGLVRRLLELDAPTFDSLDRIAGAGVNPAYVVPAWQSAMAGIAAVTGLDPATVVEAMAMVAVVLAACAAAGLGRVVTGSVAGEVAGAAAYAWLRVFFPRRELEGDGIAYAALPGNIAIDVLLALALVVGVLLLTRRRRDAASLRVLGLTGALATVLLVVLHANYVVYLAIIGVGTAAWLFLAGPWTIETRRRLLTASLVFALPGAVAMAALLPFLATLEHFAAPVEQRIDYHLMHFGSIELLRPGHFYDWYAAPGLLALLAMPWAAWRARGAARALIAGGGLLLLAFGLVPPLLSLLGESGSLTLGLRLPRPFGLLLVAAAAVAIPDLVERVGAWAASAGARRGRYGAIAARALPLVVVAAVVAAYGYPLARREPPEYGWDWPTVVAVVGLLAVLALLVRRRRDDQPLDAPPSGSLLPAKAVGIACLLLAVCFLPSGVTSLRRGAWQSRELVAASRADDLRCMEGVNGALRALPAGGVLLADPVSGYAAQALAPSYIVADFKVWNGTTDSAGIDRRIKLLRALFNSTSHERAGAALARLAEDFRARYLLVSMGPVEPPLGSELSTFDARALREILGSGTISARRVASGAGKPRAGDAATDEERAACRFELWRLDGSESRLELKTDSDHGGSLVEPDTTFRIAP